MITNTRRKASSSTVKSSSKSRRISKASLNDSRDSDNSQRMTSQQFRSKPKMGKTSGGFEVISPEILQVWDEIKTGFKRGDWEQKLEGLDTLSDFITTNSSLLTTSKKFCGIIDIIAETLCSNNNKVVLATQDLLQTKMNELKHQLEKNAQTIVDSLAGGIVSANQLIKQSSSRLMKKLVLNESLDCSKFVPPLCNQVLNGSVRSKSTILDVIQEVIEVVIEEKPHSMKKYAYPMITKLLEKSSALKGDLKSSTHNLIGKIYEVSGEKFVNGMPSAQRDEVRQILVSLNC